MTDAPIHHSPRPHDGGGISRRTVLGGAALGTTAVVAGSMLGEPLAAHTAPIEVEVLGALVDVARWSAPRAPRSRIPALTQAADGSLIAVFDARDSMDDLPAHITVVMRRSTDGGATWEPTRTIRADTTWSAGDPSLLTDHITGRLHCFCTGAVHAGYAASGTGNDPDDQVITQAEHLVSDDHGLTWQHRRITAQVKDPAWAGMFASSGTGLQLRTPGTGFTDRIMQSYVVRIDGGNYAVATWSDDGGESWQHGEPAGPGADENKLAELSDGSVLLNTRAAGGYRRQAVSTDGGATFTAFETIPEQIDPANNGAVVRVFPDAAPEDPAARVLALSNSADPDIRRHLTLRVSFDDGVTWPAAFLLDDDASAYSTIVALEGESGVLGLLYEREGYSTISYRRIDVGALSPAPLLLEIPADTSLEAGTVTAVAVTVTNQGTEPASGAEISLAAPDGIAGATAAIPELAPGDNTEVFLDVEVPPGLAGPRPVTLRATASMAVPALSPAVGGAAREVHAARPATVVLDAAGTIPVAALELTPVIDAIYPDEEDRSLLGDLAVPWVRVRNAGGATVDAIEVSSSTGGSATVDSLDPGATAMIRGRDQLGYRLQQTDLDDATWEPRFHAQGTAGGGTVESDAQLVPFDLGGRPAAQADAAVSLPTGDARTSAFVRVRPDDPTPETLPDGTRLALTIPPGGRTSLQLVVTAPRAGALDVTARGRKLPVSASMVEEIVEVEPGGASTGGRTVDPLTPLPAYVDIGSRSPLWVSIAVPQDHPGGTETVRLTVLQDRRPLGSYPVEVTIPAVPLGPLAERPFTLDLWWHPDAIADALGLETFGEEHWVACRPYLADLAGHGQDVVNTVVVDDPWLIEDPDTGEIVPQTDSSYLSLVGWQWDGTAFTFDTTQFDRCVQEHERAGITGPIHLFAMLQFRLDQRLTYVDTRSGKQVDEEVELGDERYREAWGAFLTTMHEHLVDRGWWDRAALAFDERPKALMDAVFEVIHDVAPQWDGRISLAANSLEEADIAHSISFNHSFLAEVPAELITARLERGEPTLFYTFYDPVRPNTVTASPPMSSRMLGWEVARYGLDGYLRWTYNSWPADVLEHPSHRYGQGDEYIVYPGAEGPISSLRWESLRDGLDDAEIFRLLREQDAARADELLSRIASDDADTPEAWAAMAGLREQALRELEQGGGSAG